MTVAAKPCGFCTYLGNRCATPTFPPPRRLLDSFHTNQERSFPQPSPLASFRLILRLEKTDRCGDSHWVNDHFRFVHNRAAMGSQMRNPRNTHRWGCSRQAGHDVVGEQADVDVLVL